MTAAPAAPALSRFEYNLVTLLRFCLGHGTAERVKPLIDLRLPAPACLTPTCVHLVEQTLSRGTVQFLARSGGWRHERFLRNGGPGAGRAWERLPLGERRLAFGPATLNFLRWLTAEKPADAKETWDAPEPTPGDELFLAAAYSALRQFPDVRPALARQAPFWRNGLCRLMHAGDFAAESDAPPWAEWVRGPRAAFLEMLQPTLADHWLRSERAKVQQADWKRMRDQGAAEGATLGGFLAAAHAAGRPDLARFVLQVAAKLLAPNDMAPDYWTGGLRDNRPPRLADRLEAERRALAFVAQVGTLADWERQARSVGYFDEEYAASQLWKADWETAGGAALARKADALLARLDPLRTE